MRELEWCIGAIVVATCGAGREEGFIFRGVRDQVEVRKVNVIKRLFDGTSQVATCIYK